MARIQLLDTATREALAPFETIIDVRSPGEFAQDHVPGAINLPVLSDAERAEVGTIYVQESRLKANRIGAAYVARNIARHLEGPLADREAGFAPLVYCWRGGQRSESMATILSHVGWRTTLLVGGYRTYRRAVQSALYDAPWPQPVILLDGDTGTAKTDILNRLPALGVQILDLEALAGHRGSLLGGWPGQDQPGQKLFETRLWSAMQALDPSRPVVVEAESSKVGERMIPPALWRAMQAAPRIELVAPRPARAAYLVGAYSDLLADPTRFAATLARLPIHLGGERLKAWRGLFEAGDYPTLAKALISDHYDPAYARARRKDGRPPATPVHLADLQEKDRDDAARQVAALVGTGLA